VCSRGCKLLFFLSIIFPAICSAAPPETIQMPNLSRISRSSSMIFSGIVLRVDRHAGSSISPAMTSIQFRVVNAVRGVRRGQIIQINEWGGLWESGERYQKGEHVLLFLYSPSKIGLTSPVGGKLGRFQMDNTGHVLLNREVGRRPQIVPVKSFAAAVQRSAEK
jgi:hypothetical protein